MSLVHRAARCLRWLAAIVVVAPAAVLTQPVDSPLASQLTQQAVSLHRQGKYEQALPLAKQALALYETQLGPDHELTAVSANNLAEIHLRMGQYDQAVPLYERALAIAEKIGGPYSPDVAAWSSNLAGLYRDKGIYDKALPLYQKALAISERANGTGPLPIFSGLHNLGGLYRAMRRYDEALPLLERALKLTDSALGLEHPSTGASLSELGGLYADLGRRQEALALHQRALIIAEKSQGADHPTTLVRLGDLAALYNSMGLYQQALPLYQRAMDLSVRTVGPEHPLTAMRMSNLAGVYADIGRFDQAIPLYQQALRISEKAFGTEHPVTAARLNNLAHTYRDMGSTDLAVPMFERAIAIAEKTLGPDHPLTGVRMNNLAALHLGRARIEHNTLTLIQRALAIQEKAHGAESSAVMNPLDSLARYYLQMGRQADALPLLQRVLGISEKVYGYEHQVTGVRLSNLGFLYQLLGRLEPARQAYHRALFIAQERRDARLSELVFRNLMLLHGRPGSAVHQPSLAIWYGKQAVNTLQDMRGQMRSLTRELQSDFLSLHEGSYQTLANLLIEEGRIAEAEQVLAMLKENELFELTRSAGGQPGRREADYVGREREALSESRRLAAQAVKDSTELALLDRRARSDRPLTEAEQVRQLSLLKVAETSRAEYQRFFAQLGQSFAEAARRPVLKEADSQVTRLRSQVEQDGDGAVGLHYSVAEDCVGIIVSTARGAFGRFSNVGRKALTNQVVALRKAVLARADTQAPAQALWKMLIEPVQADIQAAGAKTLVMAFSDELRYLPLAALQNPSGRYLVEDYGLALWASAADTRAAPSATPWNVSALGLTQARQGFPALPGVLRELNGIVRSGTETVRGGRGGVLPGSIVLDSQFDRRAFESALSGRSNVVHVASHFDFRPGDESRSVLLLGEGEPLSLGQLAVMDFGRVEQLTLSACDTATGGGINENGAEVEGLAAVVLRQRAQSVLATLWKVADDSTARLMHDFYAGRGAQNPLSRAQALRQAQLQMLRSAEPGTGTGWRHPYYWAPFVLSGNWL